MNIETSRWRFEFWTVGHESLYDLFQPRPQGLSFQGTGKRDSLETKLVIPFISCDGYGV